MALNCRKDFPNVTRQNTICLWEINTEENMKTIMNCLCCISYCVRCINVPVAHIAGAVFVSGAACAATDAIDVLVTLRGVLCKIYTSSKHATDVRMTLIKSFMDDGIYEWRTWKKKRIKLQHEQNMQFRAKYSNNGTFIAHLIYIKVQKRVVSLCIWLINFQLKLWRTFGINHDTICNGGCPKIK